MDRLPPYSEEAEKGTLGSILLDWERVMDLCVSAEREAGAESEKKRVDGWAGL